MNTLVTALGCGFVLTGVAWALLLRHEVMDLPNHRSAHAHPTPRGGGIAILPSVAIAIMVAGVWDIGLATVLVGSFCLGAVGLVDDFRSVSAMRRLAVQLLVGLACAGVLATEVESTAWIVTTMVAGTVWLAGTVNAYNFMDGANGVAGMTALISGLWFALLGHRLDEPVLLVAGLALAGASAGFLPWNFPRARVFMGDVGSYSVGFLLGGLAVLSLLGGHGPDLAIAPLLVILCDSVVTLIRRVAAGEGAMEAHQDHAYQRLTNGAGSSPAAATAVSVATIACLAATWLPLPATLAGWAAILAVYMFLPTLVRTVPQRA